jgi:hypothetical protein
MNTITVLPYGSKVQLTSVDMYGYCGRDNHPEAHDVGFLGFVVGNMIAYYDHEGCLLTTRENVLGGTEVVDDEDYSLADVCYKVRASDGRELELMNHEIDEI